MYCGSCMRDNTLVRALRARDIDATLVPTYTPIRTDVEDVSEPRIFYGGIGVYLSQVFPPLRRMPRFLARWLSAPGLLRFASRFAVENRAQELGELTLSILRGRDGHHSRELNELCDWLEVHLQPDIVHLTNGLFAGLAPELARRLRVPVLCSLQGEDLFLDQLESTYRERALELIRLSAESIGSFVAVSDYYRDMMAQMIGLPVEQIQVVKPGIPHETLTELSRVSSDSKEVPTRSVVIGYFARICEEKGFGLLAEAFRGLKAMPGMENVRLRVAGYLGPTERPFVDRTMKSLEQAGLAGDVELLGTLDYKDKVEFFHNLDVFCVPALYRDPMGLYVLEAFAAGLPVVAPRHGAFPEMVGATGGGVLVEPDDVEGTANALADLVHSPERRLELGRSGREAVARLYGDDRMALETLDIYHSLRGEA